LRLDVFECAFVAARVAAAPLVRAILVYRLVADS